MSEENYITGDINDDTPAAPVSFATNIVPMWTARDIRCMSNFSVLLNNYEYMSDAAGDSVYADHANARHVYARLNGDETPQMPMGEKLWTAPDNPQGQKNLETLNAWITIEPAFQP